MPFFHHGTEKIIVNGCLNNDRHFQKMLFDRYKDAMYTLVFRILRNEAQASDALQEGFLQVFTCLGSYRYKSSLGSWIKTIMVRSALRILDKEHTQPERNNDIPDIPVTWDQDLTGEMLDKVIAELSPGYRSVFLLIEVEGYSHKEVAEMLRISEGTSKSQLCRAKIILQEKLKLLKARG